MAQSEAQASQNGTDAERAAAGSFSPYSGDPDVNEQSPDDGIVFLADLARAMQATAAAEQARIVEATDRRRQLHIGGIRAREAAEADEIHELADEDVKGINAWADGEIKRLKLERERRITARREQLQIRLEEHRAVIAREVEAVESAVATYRSEIDRYFNGLESETDPEVIAREASKRPVFPALDRIGPDDAPGGGGIAVGVLAQAATLEAVPDQAAHEAVVIEEIAPQDTAPDETAPAAAEAELPSGDASDAGQEQPHETAEQPVAEVVEETPEVQAEVIQAEVGQAESPVSEADAVPAGIADPDAEVRWDAAEDAAAQAAADDMAGAENTDQPAENAGQPAENAEQPAEEAAAATVVMPRSSGAGSWLRWPNNNNNSSDRFGPGR